MSYKQTQASLKETDDRLFDAVVVSDNRKLLGEYLFDRVGFLSIADLVENSEVKTHVGAVLNKAEGFVGESLLDTEAEVDASEQVDQLDETAIANRVATERALSLAPELESSADELARGEVWNALARLRREIEFRLREIASVNGISNARRGARSLLRSSLGTS